MTLIKNKDYRRPHGNKDATFDDIEAIIGEQQVFDVKEHIDYIIAVVDGNSNDWLVIKHLIQRYLSPHLRKFFSAEDYSTRKQKPNDFDYACMNYWKETTGVELIIPKHKMHPENHIYRPRGWKLAVINELKKRKAIEEGKREPDPIIKTQLGKRGSKRGRPNQYGFNKYSKVLREYFESLEDLDQRADQCTDNRATETVDNPEGE